MILADFYAFLVPIGRIGTDSVMLCGHKLAKKNRFFAKSESDFRPKNKKIKKSKIFCHRKNWRKSGTFPRKMT